MYVHDSLAILLGKDFAGFQGMKKRLFLFVAVTVCLLLGGCSRRAKVDEATLMQNAEQAAFENWAGWTVSKRPDSKYYIVQFEKDNTVLEHLILVPGRQMKVRLSDHDELADHFTPLKDLASDPLWSDNYQYMNADILKDIMTFVRANQVETLIVYDDSVFIQGNDYDLCYSFREELFSDIYERINEHWTRRGR